MKNYIAQMMTIFVDAKLQTFAKISLLFFKHICVDFGDVMAYRLLEFI